MKSKYLFRFFMGISFFALLPTGIWGMKKTEATKSRSVPLSSPAIAVLEPLDRGPLSRVQTEPFLLPSSGIEAPLSLIPQPPQQKEAAAEEAQGQEMNSKPEKLSKKRSQSLWGAFQSPFTSPLHFKEESAGGKPRREGGVTVSREEPHKGVDLEARAGAVSESNGFSVAPKLHLNFKKLFSPHSYQAPGKLDSVSATARVSAPPDTGASGHSTVSLKPKKLRLFSPQIPINTALPSPFSELSSACPEGGAKYGVRLEEGVGEDSKIPIPTSSPWSQDSYGTLRKQGLHDIVWEEPLSLSSTASRFSQLSRSSRSAQNLGRLTARGGGPEAAEPFLLREPQKSFDFSEMQHLGDALKVQRLERLRSSADSANKSDSWQLSESQLQDLPPAQVFWDDWVSRLLLQGPSITQETLLAYLRSYVGIKKLELFGCTQLEPGALSCLQEFPGLQAVKLNFCPQLDQRDYQVLAQLPHLKRLVVKRCSLLVEASALNQHEAFSELQSLELGGLTTLSEQAIGAISGYPKLVHLKLSRIENLSEAEFKPLLSHKKLRYLEIKHCPSLRFELGNLWFLLDRLAYLSLGYNGPLNTRRLVQVLDRLHQGQSIRLTGMPIEETVLKTLMKQSNLIHLCVADSPVQLKAWPILGLLKNLHTLDLSGCDLSNGKLSYLDQLRELHNLRLARTIGICAEDLAALGHLNKLFCINLKNCLEIDDKSLAVLSTYFALKYLDLSGCIGISSSGILCACAPGFFDRLEVWLANDATQLQDEDVLHIFNRLPHLKKMSLKGCSQLSPELLESLQTTGRLVETPEAAKLLPLASFENHTRIRFLKYLFSESKPQLPKMTDGQVDSM